MTGSQQGSHAAQLCWIISPPSSSQKPGSPTLQGRTISTSRQEDSASAFHPGKRLGGCWYGVLSQPALDGSTAFPWPCCIVWSWPRCGGQLHHRRRIAPKRCRSFRHHRRLMPRQQEVTPLYAIMYCRILTPHVEDKGRKILTLSLYPKASFPFCHWVGLSPRAFYHLTTLQVFPRRETAYKLLLCSLYPRVPLLAIPRLTRP